MDKCPSEIICKILDLLTDPMDLANARLVCTEWFYLIKNVIIQKNTSLAILLEERSKRSFDTNIFEFKPIDSYKTIITYRKDNLLRLKIIKILYARIKYLYISKAPMDFHPIQNFWTEYAFDLSNLEPFKEIEKLEIDQLSVKENSVLSLPKLVYLSIQYLVRNSSLILDTPNLSKFQNKTKLGKFKFIYPDKITHLSITSYDSIPHFKNLEFLYFGAMIDRNIIQNLPKLKEIHFQSITTNEFSDLLSRRKKLRKIYLKFYYFGILVDNLDSFQTLFKGPSFLHKIDTKLLIENYDRFSSIQPLSTEIDYNQLMNYFNQKLPCNFFDRFINIYELFVIGFPVRKIDFINFIRNCKNLCKLTIIKVGLDLEFYNRFHNWNLFLEELFIDEIDDAFDNLDFILTHQFLRKIHINFHPNYDQIEKIFIKFPNLFEFKFLLRSKELTIKNNNSKYYIKFGNDSSIDSNVEATIGKRQCMLDFLKNLFELSAI